MADRIYYVISDDNCKFEGMTKEQIITAIQQAVSTGEIKDIDAGFVTKIKEQNAGKPLQFWVGTTAQFNAITEKAEDTFYILTDEDTQASLDEIAKQISEIIDGTIKVPKSAEADHATSADNANHATSANNANHATSANNATYAENLCANGEELVYGIDISGLVPNEYALVPKQTTDYGGEEIPKDVDLGTSAKKFRAVYANEFHGELKPTTQGTVTIVNGTVNVNLAAGIYIMVSGGITFLMGVTEGTYDGQATLEGNSTIAGNGDWASELYLEYYKIGTGDGTLKLFAKLDNENLPTQATGSWSVTYTKIV